MRLWVLLPALLIGSMSGPALAAERQCTDARDAGHKAVADYYGPRIIQVNEAIDEIKKKNGDPSAFAIRIGEGKDQKFYTFPEIAAKLERDKNIGDAAVDKQVDDECEAKLKPVQDVMNEFVDIATFGIAKMLPGKMGFVDVSDILAGYPLGGPNAFIPKARDDIIKTLGISGTGKKIIVDPLHAITDLFK